jgi:hypothetical protein
MFFKIRFNIILPPTHRSSSQFLAYRSLYKILYGLLFFPMHGTLPTHSILLDPIILKMFCLENYRMHFH